MDQTNLGERNGYFIRSSSLLPLDWAEAKFPTTKLKIGRDGPRPQKLAIRKTLGSPSPLVMADTRKKIRGGKDLNE